MGILAIVDTVLGLLHKVSASSDDIVTLYNSLRQVHPVDLPERTDAEIIEVAHSGFKGNIDDINASLAALKK